MEPNAAMSKYRLIKRLSAVSALTVLLALGAGCEDGSAATGQPQETESVQTESADIAKPGYTPMSEPTLEPTPGPTLEPTLEPTPEPTPSSAFPEYTEEEYLAFLAAQFDKVYRLELPADSQYYSIEVISDEEVVYSVDRNDASSSELYRYNFRSGSTEKVASLDGKTSSLHYSPDSKLLEISYWQGENIKYKTWSPSTGSLNDKPRVVLAENGQWTLFRSNEGPGIWASARDGSGKFQLTSFDLDNSPLWIPETNRFVYIAHTGRKIADGSGYGYSLNLYDMTTRTNKRLAFGEGPWIMRGWLEPGRKLLVDHAFNEGADRNYAEPFEVDLKKLKERRLLPEGMDGYDMQFNAADSSFVVAVPGFLAFYDRKGEIASLQPWFTDSAEQLAIPFEYSPAGTKGAYVMNAPYNENTPFMGGRLVISDALGRYARRISDEFVPITDIEWSPEGSSIAAIVQEKHGTFLVMEKL